MHFIYYIRQVNGVNWQIYCFHCVSVLPSICEQSINRLRRHCCAASVNLFAWYNCFNRNIFDSCVNSWEYFHSDNISMETSLSWLSDDIVRFKIKMGVEEKCTKMYTMSVRCFGFITRSSKLLCEVRLYRNSGNSRNNEFSPEMYSTRAWKVENISIRTIYRWKRRYIGFLKM